MLAVHDEPGELEPGVLDHRPQRADPHLARAPQDHSHLVPPSKMSFSEIGTTLTARPHDRLEGAAMTAPSS